MGCCLHAFALCVVAVGAAALQCPARPGTTRIQGLNAMPGGLALAGKTRGCSDWCGMHKDNRDINAHRDSTDIDKIDRAVAESDFIVVDGWRAIRAPHFRFVGSVLRDQPDLKGVPEGTIAVAHNMVGQPDWQCYPKICTSLMDCFAASVCITKPLHRTHSISRASASSTWRRI